MINVATLWIINEYGEILLAQRSYQKANEPGTWGPSVTGKLELGETFDEALLREVQEELGLEPTDYTPHPLLEKVFDHPDGEQRKFVAYYTVLPKAKTNTIRLQESEVEGVAWFLLGDIQEKMQSSPEALVPSAADVWPETFLALQDANVIAASASPA